MKSIRLIISISVVILLSFSALAQELDTMDVSYDYKLIPTGEIKGEVDTSYNVIFVIDILDMKKLKTLTITDKDKQIINSINTKDLDSNIIVEKTTETYRIDLDDWTRVMDWNVQAELLDGKKVILKNKNLKKVVAHIVEQPEILTWDVKIFDGELINEEAENREESKPEKQD